MTSIEQYRTHAEDCLEHARTDENERDKPLWITLAQSWLQLAEHADRIGSAVTSAPQAPSRDRKSAGSASA